MHSIFRVPLPRATLDELALGFEHEVDLVSVGLAGPQHDRREAGLVDAVRKGLQEAGMWLCHFLNAACGAHLQRSKHHMQEARVNALYGQQH